MVHSYHDGFSTLWMVWGRMLGCWSESKERVQRWRFCRTSAEIAEIVFKYASWDEAWDGHVSLALVSPLSGHWLLSWVLFGSSLSGSSSGGLSCKQTALKGEPSPLVFSDPPLRVPNLCLPQFSTSVTKALSVSGSWSA